MSMLPNSRLVLAMILSSILFPLLSIAQVTIKEKVEIKPKAPAKVQSSGNPQLHLSGSNYDSFHLAIVASPDTLLLGSSTKLVVIAQDVYDHEIIPTEDFLVTIHVYPGSLSVTGGAPVQEGVTVLYSLARAGRVRYIADEAWSDYCTDVWLEAYRRIELDWMGQGSLTIAQPYCAKVIVDPPKLAPGDTATVTFEKTGGNDMYDVSILANDSTSGVLISSSGGRGIALQGVTGTVQYVAPASISADSVVVSISASSYGSCEWTDMQSSVTLQAKKLPGVAATQSLRSGPPAIAHETSLQKKSAGHSMRLPLTADEQHALMMSIAKRVAAIGGGGTTTSLTSLSPLKRAPGQVTAKSTALNSDRAVLERIGKLLANSSCTAGEVVVERKILLPVCGDLPAISFVPLRRDDDQRGCNYDATTMTLSHT